MSDSGENFSVQHLGGDALRCLKKLPDNHFDCVITSPPYWGLRNYGVEGQIGLEPTLSEHMDIMIRVFDEVHRVLKPTGTCWVNYGDCYATTPNGRSAADTKTESDDDRTFRDKPLSTVGPICSEGSPSTKTRGSKSANKQSAAPPSKRIMAGGYLKPKDLVMVPNRFAIAMQEAGWWVRSEIIWAKPNPMPESIKDRPATSHEKIFMFTKEPRYFYNREAVRQIASEASINRWAQDIESQAGSSRANGGAKANGNIKAVGGPKKDRQRGHSRKHAGFNERWDAMSRKEQQENGRNLRNYEPAPMQVWKIATRPFKEAHFATFPPELVERCLSAGCPEGGSVLDPFGGAGTTGLVASYLGFHATLIELSADYRKISIDRIKKQVGGLFETAVTEVPDFSQDGFDMSEGEP